MKSILQNLQLLSTKTIGILILVGVGCYTAVSFIAHSYIVSLEAADLNVFQFVDNSRDRNAQAHANTYKVRKSQLNLQLKRPRLGLKRLTAASFQEQNERAAKLKEHYELVYSPKKSDRIRDYVYKHLRRPFEYKTQHDLPYDVYNCPREGPPPNYPFAWNIMNVIGHWNPMNTTEPERIHQSLCVFDYEADLSVAELYRKAEVPFLLRNTPVLLQTAERWNRNPGYLSSLLQDYEEKTEHSHNNHFMYFNVKSPRLRIPDGWKPPMELTELTFDAWQKLASTVTTDEPNQERYYFRVNGVPEGPHEFLFQELPIFQPTPNNFFMVDPKEQRGINCRFGMKGVMAETHFDESRNFIVLLGGQRRYILAHPQECQNLQLYPFDHPSGRHSAVDWTNPDLKKFPGFKKAEVHEVVLQAGDALYLPTLWFHFVVSLNVNYQCNARSGKTFENFDYIRQCGFMG